MKPSTRSLDAILAKYFSLDEKTRQQISKRSSPLDDLVYLGIVLKLNEVVDVLEVGTFLGQSACFLASCISGTFYTVNSNPREMVVAEKTAERLDVKNIKFVTADSREAIPPILKKSGDRLGAVYIDGFHSYEHAIAEFRAVETHLSASPGAAVFFNAAGKLHPDGIDDGGVPRAVEEVGGVPIGMLGQRIAVRPFGAFRFP